MCSKRNCHSVCKAEFSLIVHDANEQQERWAEAHLYLKLYFLVRNHLPILLAAEISIKITEAFSGSPSF